MTDLVLASRSGREEVILPNVPGQLYTFGSEYPGDRGRKEEFIFCKLNPKGVVNPTHFIISVDEQGNYWIQNDTRNAEKKTTRSSVFNTFVNAERVKAVEVRLLKIGDVISVGFPGTKWAGPGPCPADLRHPYYHVTERIIPNRNPQIEESEAADTETEAGLMADADSPLANNLILAEIMAYLPVPDLKNARLVSKKWRDEASKVLEKKGQVSFTFDAEYRDPKFSTRVSRYLQEMEGLKIQTLHIILRHPSKPDSTWPVDVDQPLFLSPGGPGVKMMDDIRKLLQSPHNFSTLFLDFDIKTESDFQPFHLIFQELGGKLVELKLKALALFLPTDMPPFPLMTNLKKLTDAPALAINHGIVPTTTRQACASLFVPLFARGLEHFTCHGNGMKTQAEDYLQEFVKHEMPKLKEIVLSGAFSFINSANMSLLLQLKTPLTFLKIRYCSGGVSEPGEDCPLLESLLLKHSKSLRHLVLEILYFAGDKATATVKFPPFPKLEELVLDYPPVARINWETGQLNYKEHFPTLRKLVIKPPNRTTTDGADDQIFNSFFPEGGNMRCETVKDLWVPVLPYPSERHDAPPNEDPFQPRIEQIKEMFPNAVNMNFIK